MDFKILEAMTLDDINKLENAEGGISHFIEEYMVDECGLIYSGINVNTLKPWTDEELSHYDIFPLFRKCPSDHEVYEDSLMATGEYALSHIIKYEVTKDSRAITTASQQIHAILRVLYEGELYEKGYLPKPYGGIRRASYSHEISPDQYIKAYVALRAYQPYSPRSLKETIDSYLVAIADYFLIRGFRHPYFETSIVSIDRALHATSIYIPSLYVAYKITGDKKYRESIHRFNHVLDKLASGKQYANFNICSLLCEGFSLALNEGLEDGRLKNTIKNLWECNIPMVSHDGLGYEYSGITDENQCIPSLRELEHEKTEPLNTWSFERWRSNVKTSCVLRLSSVATLVDMHFPGTEAYKIGLFILDKVKDPKMMLRLNDTDGKQVLPEHRYLAESISGLSIASWLLGYWRLRKYKQNIDER